MSVLLRTKSWKGEVRSLSSERAVRFKYCGGSPFPLQDIFSGWDNEHQMCYVLVHLAVTLLTLTLHKCDLVDDLSRWLSLEGGC